jgi:phospho-N-acetylmuramoyl-pentapeptide-transferase
MFVGGALSKSLPVAAISAGLLSLALLIACGPYFIRWLKSRFTERIASDSEKLNELHAAKQNTPTMGGLLISSATVLAVFCFSDLTQPIVWLICGTVVSLALLGAFDDWIKLRTQRTGLTARMKLLAQLVISSVFAVCVYLLQQQQGHMPSVLIPWSGLTIQPGIYWIPWAVFVIVGASNAVNLTDGLDGLATGTTAIASLALIIVICGGRLAGVDDNIRTTAAVSCAALVGSAFGILVVEPPSRADLHG